MIWEWLEVVLLGETNSNELLLDGGCGGVCAAKFIAKDDSEGWVVTTIGEIGDDARAVWEGVGKAS